MLRNRVSVAMVFHEEAAFGVTIDNATRGGRPFSQRCQTLWELETGQRVTPVERNLLCRRRGTPHGRFRLLTASRLCFTAFAGAWFDLHGQMPV